MIKSKPLIGESIRISPTKVLLKGFRGSENVSKSFESGSNIFKSFVHGRFKQEAPGDRVQTHSAVRIRASWSGVIRKKWRGMGFGQAGVNKEVEIEKLNSKIRSLIRENSELKRKIESRCGSYSGSCGNKEECGGFGERSERDVMEVTFRPNEAWESPVKVYRRFPREVFCVPRYLGKIR